MTRPSAAQRWRERRARRARRAQAALAVLSTLVLLVTGYGWSVYHQFSAGLGSTSLLGGAPSPDGATDILLVGLDSRTDARGNPLPRQILDQLNAGDSNGTLNTDTLIVVRVPDDTAKPATAISIPRDSYVAIPGYGTHKINSAYARAANDARTRLAGQGVTGAALTEQANDAGRQSLLATVQDLTGSSIDHYAEINLAGFAEITQAVGGVPVCLNAPVRDTFSGADFAPGPQTLQGAPALAFVRQRHGLPRGDLDRIVRQQAFMASLAHQVLSAGTLANPIELNRLVTATGRYIVLDQGWDLLGFATQAQGLTGGNLSFRTIPTGRADLPTPTDGDAVEVDPALVHDFVAGLTGQPPPGEANPDADGPPPGGPITADVANASGRTGLAATVQDLLDNQGIIPGTLGNAPTSTRSEIRASAGTRPAAEQIAAHLGAMTVTDDDTVAPGHVQIQLGRDYRPADQTPPTATGNTTDTATSPVPGDDAPGAPPEPAITADGTPCVN